MIKNKLSKKLGISLVLIVILTTTMISSVQSKFGPELEISSINGGIGRVSIEILNVGDSVAEKVVSTISVKGGFLNRIDVFKECSGCGHCNTSILPGNTKVESTDQFILGLGPIDIIATANATGLPTVEEVTTGFIIGPIVIVK
jgi:hypothetical protein